MDHRRSQWPCGLRPLGCLDCGLESYPGHGCLCVVTQRSLSRTDHSSRGVLPTVVCVLTECDISYRRPRLNRDVEQQKKILLFLYLDLGPESVCHFILPLYPVCVWSTCLNTVQAVLRGCGVPVLKCQIHTEHHCVLTLR
jgi:hypothetical protein